MSNISIDFLGGGTLENAQAVVPEEAETYPQDHMFGVLPAYGFYVRHATHMRFHDMTLGFEEEDRRPALVFDDVKDVEIAGLDAEGSSFAEALMRLKEVEGAFVHGCRASGEVGTFVRLEGAGTKGIALVGNELTQVKQVVATGEGVQETGAYHVR